MVFIIVEENEINTDKERRDGEYTSCLTISTKMAAP
jgi:hypothetical protein